MWPPLALSTRVSLPGFIPNLVPPFMPLALPSFYEEFASVCVKSRDHSGDPARERHCIGSGHLLWELSLATPP